MKNLAGKVAVITGSSRGLGLATAQLFALEGAKVVLSARSKDAIEKAVRELNEQGLQAESFVCDVSDPRQVEELASFAIQKYGHFDVWVNNAGMGGPYGATLNIAPDDFMAVIHTNMFGTYYGSMMAMRHFLPRRSGKLINILGAGDKKPAPNQNAYGSTKSWIRIFTLALAKEYKDSGVGVYALQPGLMDTDFLTEVATYAEYEQRLRNIMPMLIRAGGKQPEIPARKVLWLASSATNGKTGLYVRVGSMPKLLVGFLGEGLCRLFHLPVRIVEMKIRILPSAFEPLPGDWKKS